MLCLQFLLCNTLVNHSGPAALLFHLFVVGFNFYTGMGAGFFAPLAVPALPHTGKTFWTCCLAFSFFVLDFSFYTGMGAGFFAPFAFPALRHAGEMF